MEDQSPPARLCWDCPAHGPGSGLQGRGGELRRARAAELRRLQKVAVTCCGRRQERTARAWGCLGQGAAAPSEGRGRGRTRQDSLAHTDSDREPGVTPRLRTAGPRVGGPNCGVLAWAVLPTNAPRKAGGQEL